MKLSDNPPRVIDQVMTEVRSIKQAISKRHGNDIDRLLASLMAQEREAGIRQAEQGGGLNDPSAAAPES